MHVLVVGDVIAIIAQGRGIKRQQPECRDPQVLQIVQLLGQSWKITDAIAVTVVEGPHVEFVDDPCFSGLIEQIHDGDIHGCWRFF